MIVHGTASILSKEVRIGLLSIAAGLVFYFGVQFLRGTDLLSTTHHYHITYDRVDGLTVGNPVTVKGLAVGKVENIELEAGQSQQLKVTISVDKDVPVNRQTTAELGSSDLLGGKRIALTLGNSSELLPNDASLPGSIEVGMVDKIADKAEPVMARIDTTTMLVNTLLRDFSVTQKKLNATLDGLTQSTSGVNDLLADNKENLSATAHNLKQISAGFVKTEQNLRELMVKFNRVGDTLEHAQLGQAINNASKSLHELNSSLASLNSGKGTMGKMLKNDSLYNNLSNASRSLDQLLIDFRQNPKRYVHFSLIGRK